MSRSAVIVFGLALVLLGLGAIVSFMPDDAPMPSGPLLGVQPSEISVLRVYRPGESDAEIVTRSDADRWRFRFEGSAIPAGDGWPVLAARGRGIARVLAGMQAIDRAPRGDIGDGLRVEVGLADGSWQTLLFDTSSVGGRRIVEINDERWLVDAAVVDVFQNPGPPGWRNPSALPDLNLDVTRIVIETPTQQLRLARTGDAWRIESPFVARADDASVRRLITSLAGLRVERFIDDASSAEQNGSPPRVRIICETDERTLGDDDRVAVTTLRTSLSLAGPADVAGNTFFASDGLGRRLTVAGSALSDLSVDPESYLALTPTRHAPADIGMVQLAGPTGQTQAFRRGLGSWSRLHPDGSMEQIDSELVDSLLHILCETTAASASISPPPGRATIGTLSLLDFDNGPLVRFAIGSTPEGKFVVEIQPIGGDTPVYLLYDQPAPVLVLPVETAGPAAP